MEQLGKKKKKNEENLKNRANPEYCRSWPYKTKKVKRPWFRSKGTQRSMAAGECNRSSNRRRNRKQRRRLRSIVEEQSWLRCLAGLTRTTGMGRKPPAPPRILASEMVVATVIVPPRKGGASGGTL